MSDEEATVEGWKREGLDGGRARERAVRALARAKIRVGNAGDKGPGLSAKGQRK